jgi:hydrogen peroxide-dependent heme synthase
MRDPNVPESLEGWWILHRMFAFDRVAWDGLGGKRRARIAGQASALFEHLQQRSEGDLSLCALVAHECDFMLVHYGQRYDDLVYLQTLVDKLDVRSFLTPRSSYTSVLELGLYDATAKIHAELERRALRPHTPEWIEGFDELLRAQAESPHVAPRLYARFPQRRYTCFYPMNKRRGERDNWYSLPYEERAKLMNEHGKVGRSFHGKVTQVISGSIGYDDYEWGVDLYADDPLVFKKLIYEMRFDEASAKYAEFGPFYSGVQFSSEQLAIFLDGEGVPQLTTA